MVLCRAEVQVLDEDGLGEVLGLVIFFIGVRGSAGVLSPLLLLPFCPAHLHLHRRELQIDRLYVVDLVVREVLGCGLCLHGADVLDDGQGVEGRDREAG